MIRAIIFDLDGVICFTDKYHYLAWKAIADQLGVHFDEIINHRLRGVSRLESLNVILERYDGTLGMDQKQTLMDQKNTEYRSYLARMSPADLHPDTLRTLKVLRARGYLLAIGSVSKNTPYILERLGLSDFFDAVSDGNGLINSKPDPEVFLKASERLGIPPESCLVVEDAVAGIEAARHAGMVAVSLGDASTKGAGDYCLDRFDQLLDILPLNNQM